MTELHLRQLRFTPSACGSFIEHHEMIQKYKETSDLNYIYQKILDKACFGYELCMLIVKI